MKIKLQAWKKLPSEQKDYFFIYITGALWAVTYFSLTPIATLGVIDRTVLGFWLGSAVVGAALGVAGLLRQDNLLIERLGVNILMVTPLIYGALQVAITFSILVAGTGTPEAPWYGRIALIVMAIWVFLFLNKRRRQLRNKVQEAKLSPLPAESEGNKN